MEISQQGIKDAEERLIGYLSVKGTARFPTLVFTTQGGERYKILFDGSENESKRDEIKSMAGLKLEIEGLLTDRGMIFRDYRIVPDEEEIAIVGTKGEDGTIIDLGSGEEFVLFRDGDRLFLKESGSVIWVIGERVSKGILVKRYGVIKRSQSSSKEEKAYLK